MRGEGLSTTNTLSACESDEALESDVEAAAMNPGDVRGIAFQRRRGKGMLYVWYAVGGDIWSGSGEGDRMD